MYYQVFKDYLNDPKFKMVARKSKVKTIFVIGIFDILMSNASSINDNGNFRGDDTYSYNNLLQQIEIITDVEKDKTELILTKMHEVGLIDESKFRLLKWNRHNAQLQPVVNNTDFNIPNKSYDNTEYIPEKDYFKLKAEYPNKDIIKIAEEYCKSTSLNSANYQDIKALIEEGLDDANTI